MLMADVLLWLLIAVAFVLAMPALWVLDRGLWPEAFERKRRVAECSLTASFFLGLIPAVLAGAFASVTGKRLGIAVVLVLGLVLLWGILGLSGLAAKLGARLWPEAPSWRQSRNGGLVLVCSALLPVVGWFFILPVIAVTGMGMQLRSRLSSKAVTLEQGAAYSES